MKYMDLMNDKSVRFNRTFMELKFNSQQEGANALKF